MAAASGDDQDAAIERFKVQKLIASLQKARGSGTSMISLILSPGTQISQTTKMLTDEYGTASNIKSRVTRQSVLSAITSAQHRLKQYSKCPPNGLVVYCGEVMTEDGKEKKLSIDFEPFKPINTSMYLCDSRFHTEPLGDLLQDDKKFGFIVMDGNGCLFGTLCGNHREVVHKFSVELPKKHGRGGQSALRFARLRLEKRHNYVRKVAESAVNAFISADQPNVAGLVLAGSAEFKNQLQTSDLFDPRLAAIVVKVVDVSYGGENGFNQAIELSAEALANVKFVAEKKLVGQFFDEIARDTGCYCFGVRDIMHALDMSAVETLIVYEDLEDQRYELRNPATGEITVKYFRPDQEKERALFQDPETGVDLDVADKMPLVEWLAQNFKSFGTKLEFVSDKSQEGSQFVQGFGGIGGLLRWKVDFMELAELIEGGYEVEDDDDFM